jgi:transcriptional regulator with XRE-family HTH domain
MSVEIDGTRLKALREMRVMERKELAGRCGISYSTLSQLETNRRRARAETVKRLAGALGVPPAELARRLKVVERLLEGVG